MGIFDFLKKTSPAKEESFEPIRNNPEVLTTKLLYYEKPEIDGEKILAELDSVYKEVNTSGDENTLLFFFPDIKIHLSDASMPAQLTILNCKGSPATTINESSLQQNWHWNEAGQIAKECLYEVHISDLMTRSLEYKPRIDLYSNFLQALIKVTNPQVIHSLNAQKLIAPTELAAGWTSPEQNILHAFVNVRLFNISNGEKGEVLMDTIGLHSLGLPDFQVRFSGLNATEVAELLWNYAYYVFEHGDVIESGNTVQGLTESSKWKTEKQMALVDPERIVIDLQP